MNDKMWATISKKTMPEGITRTEFRKRRIKVWQSEYIKDSSESIAYFENLSKKEFYQKPHIQELLSDIIADLKKQHHQQIVDKIAMEKYGVELNG